MGSVQDEADRDFSAAATTHDFHALLFDMDGTIIDSTDAIERHWKQVGHEIGVSGEEILKTSHGRRSIDVLALLAPERANWEYVSTAEGRIPELYGESAVEIPGSRQILDELEDAGVPWAIVTSGTRPLVEGWLNVMKLAKPRFMVTAEEVRGRFPKKKNDGYHREVRCLTTNVFRWRKGSPILSATARGHNCLAKGKSMVKRFLCWRMRQLGSELERPLVLQSLRWLRLTR